MSTPASSRPKGPDWLVLPEGSRVLPFLAFMLVTSVTAGVSDTTGFWLYAAKTIAVGMLLLWLRPWLPEMKWAVSGEAIGVGLGIAVLWLVFERVLPSVTQIFGWFESGMSVLPKAKPGEPWNPVAHFKDNSALGWSFVVIRVLGRSLVVPAVEEVFYRSFVYRMLIDTKFTDVALSTYKPVAFFVTSGLFALAHGVDLFIPGFLCGMAYQWLALRKNRLGDAMTAHAITNFVISIYTIWRGDWIFT